jgi:Hydrolases of the alpha/beta superfamily
MVSLAAVTFAVIAAAGALFLAAAWRYQERIVWQPPDQYPNGDPGGATRVTFTAADGQPLFAYVVDNATDTTRSKSASPILVFHGNADLAAWMVPWARELSRRTSRRVLVPEYRGYAGLPGAPSYEGSALDASAASRFARDSLNSSGRPLALYGHSLGAAIATELASREGAEVLVLQSPFSSVRAMARVLLGAPILAVWPVIARVHFDNVARVRVLDAPVWIAHGDRDAAIPTRMGREVFAAARRQGELLIVPTAGHNDVAEVGGAAYWSWLERALSR